MSPPNPAVKSEHGHPGYAAMWGVFDDIEENKDLKWPGSVLVYEKMRRTSGKVGQTVRAITQPIRRTAYSIDPNGAKDEIVERLSEQIGLPIDGLNEDEQPQALRLRSRGRFSFREHWREVQESLIFGHMAFNQVWSPEDDGLLAIHKLSPRLPHTINEIKLAQDGMIEYIKQTPANFSPGVTSFGQDIKIPIDELVWYAIDRVGSNWVGFSILRQAYPHWMLQQRLYRVDAVTKERNGMGIPSLRRTIPQAPTPDEEAQAEDTARRLRAGEFAGLQIPYGWELKINGVEGTLPDTLASAKHHGEEIAGSMLTQFLSLGTTETGARSVGEIHMEVYRDSLMGILDDELDVFNQHEVEDWVDLNWGETERAPRVKAEEISEELTEAGIEQLVKAGALKPDKSLRDHVRRTRRLPKEDDIEESEPTGKSYQYDLDFQILTIDERRAQIGLPPMEDGSGGVPPVPSEVRTDQQLAAINTRRKDLGMQLVAAKAWAGTPLKAAASKFRRELTDREVQAATDFEALDAQWTSSLQALVARWKDDVRVDQIDELIEQIITLIDAGDIDALGDLAVTLGPGRTALEEFLPEFASIAADSALAEAEAQGANAAKPSLDDINELLLKRAAATDALLGKSLSEAAGRKALTSAGGSLTGADVGALVREHLDGLTDAYLEEQLGGTLTAAQNAGRMAVMDEAQATLIVASELLDGATCDLCSDVDGTEYTSVAEAEADYPTGGFIDCLGGTKCRGTLVGIYGEAEASV